MPLQQAPLSAFSEFARHMLSSWDIDPVYPVLKQLISDLELEPAQAEWLTILYLAWYELSSATTAFMRYPDPRGSGILGDVHTLKLPTGIERRGLRTADAMQQHLLDWLSRFDGRSFFTPATDFFYSRCREDRYRNNSVLSQYVSGVKFNGRWASYKACEVLNKVLGFPNSAPDAGHEGSTGPRQGLLLFFPPVHGNSPLAIRALDQQTQVLIDAVAAYGVTLEVEEVETLLCDFKSLARGAYYVGHDTDLMLEGIRATALEDTRVALLHARRALPVQYRGEINGWDGRDREAMRAYVQTGAVLHRSMPHGRFVEGAVAA